MGISRRDLLRLGAVALVPACGGRDPIAGLANPPFDIARVTSNEDFYVVSYNRVPVVDASTWRLTIDGLVSSSVSLALDDMRAMPLAEKEHTLQCIGASPRNLAIGNAVWRGIRFVDLLKHAGITRDASAKYVHIESADAYLNQLDASELDDREVWLVIEMNGEPLPAAHGFPARFLVSNRYGYKNPKWVTKVTFAAEPVVGTWQQLGYPDDGTNRPAAFVELPAQAQTFAQAELALVGSAYCGGVGIKSIELSRDNGKSWEPVEVTFAGAPDVWSLWRYEVEPLARGKYVFLVRVSTVDGRSSLEENPSDNAGWQGYGRIVFTIA